MQVTPLNHVPFAVMSVPSNLLHNGALWEEKGFFDIVPELSSSAFLQLVSTIPIPTLRKVTGLMSLLEDNVMIGGKILYATFLCSTGPEASYISKR